MSWKVWWTRWRRSYRGGWRKRQVSNHCRQTYRLFSVRLQSSSCDSSWWVTFYRQEQFEHALTLPPTEDGSPSWLCGDFFSMADVSLAVILHRLKFLGLSQRYWGNGNRVNVETYYMRVVERPAFRRVLGHVNNILISAVLPVAFRVARKNAPVIVGATLVISILGGAAYLAFLYMKKRMTAFSWGRWGG